MWDQCVIDASMGCRDGMFCFCPIEGEFGTDDFVLVSGMNFIGDRPPERMKLVGIVHEDGQAAVDLFCKQHKDHLDALRKVSPAVSE